MKRYIYIFLATLCTGLGLAGTFLPVLPTTPFLLLAIFLYMRSSKAGVKMILRNRYLAPYVKSYFSRRGIPVAILVRTLFLLWITIGACIIWATDNLYMRLFLLLVAVGVTVHLVGRREKGNH
ncbi:MAG: DUF454 domain-containing protein [Bacteroidales bacterium]|nr:DUF454 domain-containing protein [Bacteroidales bacterium]